MGRAPIVLAATAAGTAALLSYHPHRARGTLVAAPAAAKAAPAGGKTVSGAVEDTRYGPVQVRITVAGGKLSDVTSLQLPQNDPRSYQISSYAAPLLRQEALTSHSASIDAVSGATFTSEGFIASLQTALQSAGIA